MAFDQNLEADRIHGFNIFSAFVRVPLLVIGGILGSDESSLYHDAESDLVNNQGRSNEDITENPSSVKSSRESQFRVLEMDCTQRQQRLSTSRMDHSNVGCAAENLKETCNSDCGINRTKKMTWSDESGLPLVYENDESSINHEHNRSPYSSVIGSSPKPTKSAMRKSSRHQAHRLPDHDLNTRERPSYIPHMNPRTAGKGFIIPSKPFSKHISIENKMIGSNGSEMSPQWGWYINTTPPTPELYHSRSTSQSLSSSNSHQNNYLMKGEETELTSARQCDSFQNKVFQNLQNSTKTNGIGGWTSIPI